MKPFFKELFEYNHQMNQKLWTLLHDHPDQSSEKALKLYSHLLNAHHIWNHRIEGIPAGMGVWNAINHATYHRGQIASECKQNGIDPLVSDYIFYKR